MSKLDLANLLKERTNQLELTKSELANSAGISRQTLYKLLNAEITEAKLSTLIKLSQVLRLHPLDLLRIYFDGAAINNQNDSSGFMGDVTYPDNSIVMINQRFTKVWSVKNLGNKTWQNRKLICVDEHLNVSISDSNTDNIHINCQRGLVPTIDSISIPKVQPGESVELSVEFQAPPYPCTAISYWKSINRNGEYCFPDKEGLSCLVKVIGL